MNFDFYTPKDFGPKLFNKKLLENWRFTTIIDWQAGGKFTWNQTGLAGVYNNMQYVDYFMMRFTINKDFFIGKNKISLYCKVNNPLNRQVLNIGLLRGLTNDPTSEIYKYFESLKDGDRVGDYKKSHIIYPKRLGENLIHRVGTPVSFDLGLKFNIDWK